MPPKDDLPRLCPKLLLYRLNGVGFGELDTDATAVSCTTGPPRNVAGIPAVRDERFRACVKALMPDVLGSDCGDGGGSISPVFWIGVERPGDDDNEPALKG